MLMTRTKKNNMKSKSFNYDDYLQLQANYSELDDAHYALFMEYSEVKAERDVAKRDCAVAERNHMNTLEQFLKAQERIDNLLAELSEYKCNTKVGCKLIEVKTGKWIYVRLPNFGGGYHVCSECGATELNRCIGSHEKYCSNCGAKMEV